MPTIHLTTFIAAPAPRVFDLSRNISLHKLSMRDRKEEVIGGVTSGLINLEETVTWKAKHFFKWRKMTSKITKMQVPDEFTEEQVHGDFRVFRHDHYFKPIDNGTLMIDMLHFEAPYGLFGKIFNQLYLTRYVRRLLQTRNDAIRDYAESGKWKALLPEKDN